jgi:hypothetical protein
MFIQVIVVLRSPVAAERAPAEGADVIFQALDKRFWVFQVVVVGELRFELCGEGWVKVSWSGLPWP